MQISKRCTLYVLCFILCCISTSTTYAATSKLKMGENVVTIKKGNSKVYYKFTAPKAGTYKFTISGLYSNQNNFKKEMLTKVQVRNSKKKVKTLGVVNNKKIKYYSLVDTASWLKLINCTSADFGTVKYEKASKEYFDKLTIASKFTAATPKYKLSKGQTMYLSFTRSKHTNMGCSVVVERMKK